jgi:hypothetical protein
MKERRCCRNAALLSCYLTTRFGLFAIVGALALRPDPSQPLSNCQFVRFYLPADLLRLTTILLTTIGYYHLDALGCDEADYFKASTAPQSFR